MELNLVIVTGLSGSGKSVAVNALEDVGYFCVDNMPPQLIATFVKVFLNSQHLQRNVAIVTDIRVGGETFQDLFEALAEIRAMECSYKLLFMDASDEVLCRRYKETRRKHPLIDHYHGSIREAVEAERKILLPAKQVADYVIDTSYVTATECKNHVNDLFVDNPRDVMHVRCVSFGYKYGIPYDSDLVFDVRCLPNPFYVPELKNHTGLEQPVYDFVMKWDQAKNLIPKLFGLIDYLIPLYQQEGKSQLIISIGCTGGKHRSVVFTQLLEEHLRKKEIRVNVNHRDIQK